MIKASNNPFECTPAIVGNSEENELVYDAGFTLVGQNLTLNSGWQWKINLESFTNPEPVVINIPFASSGKQRIDRIVATVNNTFIRVYGTESISNPVAPSIPNDTVEVTFFTVNDGTIEDPSEPVIGALYIEKETYFPLIYSGYGVLNTIGMDNKKSSLAFTGTVSQFSAVQKNNFNYYISGQPFIISNRQSVDIVIKNEDGSGNLKFRFPNAKDYLLKKGCQISFIFNLSDFIYDFIGYIPDSTGQKTITGNVTLDDSYNNCIVKVKATAVITVPYGLIKDWNAVFDSWAGATASFVQGTNVDIIETALTLLPGKMATLYQDGSTKGLTTEVYKLKGETS